ncbi:MAG: methionine--tRNA ligase [Spirochaetes bacterium]|nr:methionine--tRNA ligase [Spirochaetota bacterium]
MDKKKRLITSALPYVNNIPHLGTLIGCVLSADVFYKYCQISKIDSLFICGTDEYGTTTETRAIQEKMTPKQLCDKYYKIHKDIYDWFQIDFSYFGRTSDPKQTEIVQEIFLKLYNNGYIIKDKLIQPYCENDKIFLADRYIEGTCPSCKYENAKGDQCENCGKLLNPSELINAKCTLCGNTPIFKETKHLFLDLEKIKTELEKWINKTSKKGNWSNNALSITKGWLDQGLLKRCITRDLKWGIPVPLEDYKDKVFYVWFDAPIGYISITATKFKDWQNWWKNPDEIDLYQFMGKDNIPFHTIIFPSTLIGTKDNWTMLKTISSTEYLNYEDVKFSKSRGTGVFGDQVKETGIDSDLYRYYLLRNRPEKNDTQFYWIDFMEKVNGEIIANYANLVNRVMQFIDKFFDGIVPDFHDKKSIYASINIKNNVKEIIDLYEEIELKKALLKILDMSSIGNKFFQDNEPWSSVKTDKELAKNIIGSLACFVKDISILLYPYIPKTIIKVFDLLNLKKDDILLKNINNKDLIVNKKIKKPAILFNKLEKEQIEQFRLKFSGQQKTEEKEGFNKLHLKAGKIIEVKRHPRADKLYIEKVDLGNNEIRQIVSGLVPYYKEEELLNKKIILVYNLKPAVLRGEKSEGMLLAAENENREIVEVISPDCNIGDIISIDDAEPNISEISIEEFFSVPLTVDNFEIKYEDKNLKVNNKKITVQQVKEGKVG